MTIEEMLQTKSKEEAAYIMFETDVKSNCLYCSHFCEDEYKVWHCNSPWHEQVCRNEWKFFISHELDKGWIDGYVRSYFE